MNEAKYIIFDVESGGLPAECSVLTASFQVASETELMDELNLVIKHPIYITTAQGLSINKIDLVKHDALGISMGDARQRLKEFLTFYTDLSEAEKSFESDYFTSPKPKIKRLIPIAHGLHGDIESVKKILPGFEQYVSRVGIDTCMLAKHLQLRNKLPQISLSLTSLANHSDIQFTPHDAREDARTTWAWYLIARNM